MTLDPEDHLHWIYETAMERAKIHHIPGVTLSLTKQVMSHTLPAISSTTVIIASAMVIEAMKIIHKTGISLNDYWTLNSMQGEYATTHTLQRDPSCLQCSDRE